MTMHRPAGTASPAIQPCIGAVSVLRGRETCRLLSATAAHVYMNLWFAFSAIKMCNAAVQVLVALRISTNMCAL